MPSLQERVDAAYGAGEYFVNPQTVAGTNMRVMVTCPDHSWFITTPDNLIYNAGCKQCRGVHPRGYPIRKRDGVGRAVGRPARTYTVYIRSAPDDRLEVGVISDPPAAACLYERAFKDRNIARAAFGLVRKCFDFDRSNLAAIVALLESAPIGRQ